MTRLLAIIALLFSTLLVAPAHAWTKGSGGSTPPPAGCQAFLGDNGCAGATTLLGGYGTITPFYIDLNAYWDTAESGQLLSSDGLNSSNALQRKAWIHQNNENFAYLDYAIGSADPSTLKPISSFPHFTTGHGADCQYAATGAPIGGGPFINCTGTDTTTFTVDFEGYDFSNTVVGGVGGSTGIGCAMLYFNGAWSHGTARVINSNFQANLESTQANANYCWNASSSGATAGVMGFIYARTGATTRVADLQIDHVHFDGNVGGARLAGISQANYRMAAWLDNRQGATLPYTGTTEVSYTYAENTGHIFDLGNNTGSLTITDSAFRNMCLSGHANCHAEWAEQTGPQLRSAVAYRDAQYIVDATPTPQDGTTNSAFYITSGASNDAQFVSAAVTHSAILTNLVSCSNNTSGGFGTATPYTPALQCVGGQQGGNGFFNVNWASSVGLLDIENDVFDSTGAFFCFGVADQWANGATTWPTMSVSAGPNPALTVSFLGPNYILNQDANIYPTMWITGNEGNGWTDQQLGALGTYVNPPNFTGSITLTTLTTTTSQSFAAGTVISGGTTAVGTAIVSGSGTSWVVSISQTVGSATMAALTGTGTINVSVVPGSPIAANHAWHQWAYLGGVTQANNYNIGGVSGSRASPGAITLPAGQAWGSINLGSANCP